MYRSMQRRATYPVVTSNNIMKEIKSWNKNKIEDRKLALRQTMVDKDILNMKRLHEQERQGLSRLMENSVRKTTPSTEEYLDRSQKRYSIWREREQDRLDRRYRILYKNYMKEYSQLLVQQRTVVMSMNDVNNVEDDDSFGVQSVADDKIKKRAKNGTGVIDVSNLRLEQDEIDVSNASKSRCMHRRASTGSLLTPVEFGRRNRSGSVTDFPVILEDDVNGNHEIIADDLGNNISIEEKITNTDNNLSVEQSVEKVDNKSVQSEDSEELNNNFTSKQPEKFLLNGKRKRRKSVTGQSQNVSGLTIGKRLDRRPTLPNIAIPFNYGN